MSDLAHLGWQVVALVAIGLAAYFTRRWLTLAAVEQDGRLDAMAQACADAEAHAAAAEKVSNRAEVHGVGLAERVQKLELGRAMSRTG